MKNKKILIISLIIIVISVISKALPENSFFLSSLSIICVLCVALIIFWTNPYKKQ